MQLTCNLSNLEPALRERIVKNLQHEDNAAQAVAWANQAKITKFYRDNLNIGANGEVGPLLFVMDQTLQQLLCAQYGTLTVGSDPDFAKFIDRKHDKMFSLKAVGTRIQSGYTMQNSK